MGKENWPKKSELKEALAELDGSEGTHMLSENPTQLQIFRWKITRDFVRYKRAAGLTNREFAIQLGIDEGDVSKILHHRVEKFSTDRLITLLELIAPDLKLRVNSSIRGSS